MSARRKNTHTILHFSRDLRTMIFRAWFLNTMGYVVFNSAHRREAIKLAKHVDVAVIDMDSNSSELAVIAQEIKRIRPDLPLLLLTEAEAETDDARALADALLPKQHDPETLVQSLQRLLMRKAGTSVQVA